MYDPKYLAQIRDALAAWRERHEAEFNRERKPRFTTENDTSLNRVYTPLDLAEKGFDYLKDLGFPGEYPFERGISATMSRSQPIAISQYSGYGSPEESNRLWKDMIDAGATNISIAYDLPAQLGLDPDDPRAEGEVGRIGCSLSSQRDWETAFDGIDLNRLVVSQVYNAPAVFGIANHLLLAGKQGIPLEQVRGACQNDILKEYFARGNYIFPPAESIRLVGDTLAYCAGRAPGYTPLQVCSTHLLDMGASPVHEMALALADAITYLQEAVERGIDVDFIAPRIMFVTQIRHIDFFEHIAKHRAARRIYARIMKERFKARKPESQMMRFRTTTGATSFTKEEYLNNIARGAIGGLAAVMVGVQSLYMTGYDEHFGIPTREAILTSTQVSRIAAYETGCGDVIDPLAGSYFLETLTAELEEKISGELDAIDRRGGAVRCIQDGYFHRLISQDAYNWQKKFESGQIGRVGVNIFRSGAADDRPMRIYRANPAEEERRRNTIIDLRRKRDAARVRRALDEIKIMASLKATRENNLMPAVLEAAAADATVGEVCAALREIWGEHRECSVF